MTAEQNQTTAAFGYVSGLDGLRLAAVAIVIVRHYEIVPMLPGGFGVSLFFFISGFLISRLLIAEEKRNGAIALGKFYIRRFIRLLPPLLLMGIVAVPLLYLIEPENFSPAQIALSFLYLGNIVKFGAPIFGWKEGYQAIEPLWSLAVEEHFYLLLPPLLFLLRSQSSRIWLMVAAIVGALLLRMFVAWADPANADQINYHFTFTRLDAMAWGVLLTLLLDAGRITQSAIDRVGHLLVWIGGIAMLASMIHWTPYYEEVLKYTPQSLAIGIFFTGVIFADQYSAVRRIAEFPLISHLGRISYELYLWHFPILAAVSHFVVGFVPAVTLSLILTLLVADVAYRLTTKRLGAMRRKFGGHPV
ncbi:MAG: acyltransferase [Sphingobium sp.]|uniref:acyltransferase family protein n=1 Tax=Sphingobium sp. CECT 9361 TaxID=2845384 RepID=UPI001E365D6A|nr:acyltransferase [Sphingobium sp. CECT 9361]CAH0349663.1 O-acetyltransferase OatA [Sphingobium sp. CECT 9361]